MRLVGICAPLLFLAACPGISDDKSGDVGDYNGSGMPSPGEGEGEGEGDTAWDTAWDTGGGEGEGETTPRVSYSWDSYGLSIYIDGSSSSYYLGMTESADLDPWTGEDCYYGYYTSDGNYYNYCHPMSSTGGELESVDRISDLNEYTTLFSEETQSLVTYILIDYDTYACWTWGDAPSYYSGFGCETVNW